MNIFFTYNFYLSAKTRAGRDTGVIQGAGGGGIRPTTNDQPRTVMRNPMRDPMRDIDLMVLGDVGASTPLPSSTREHRIQFASRTREPASRLLPLMARTPSFEAQSMFLTFLYHVRDPVRGTTDFPRIRSYSWVETSSQRGPMCAALCAGH